jgi:hypothetical protein
VKNPSVTDGGDADPKYGKLQGMQQQYATIMRRRDPTQNKMTEEIRMGAGPKKT